jgi:hypothetical protein
MMAGSLEDRLQLSNVAHVFLVARTVLSLAALPNGPGGGHARAGDRSSCSDRGPVRRTKARHAETALRSFITSKA